MRNKILIITIIFISLSACRKDDNNSNNNVINTPISDGFPPGGKDYLNGLLYARKEILAPEGLISYTAEAGFSDTTLPLTNFYYLSGIILGVERAGTVKINSTFLKWNGLKSSSQLIYRDSTNNPDYSHGVSWDVGGNSNFSSFKTTVTRGFPMINNIDYLPSVFSKSVPLTIHTGANNYSNTDSIMIGISDGTILLYQYFSGKDSVFTFNPEDLTHLSTGSGKQITVYAKNFSNMVVNNKRYLYVMHSDVLKFISITP
jgi:hypothetical protein